MRFLEYQLGRCKLVCVKHHVQHAERVLAYLRTSSAGGIVRMDQARLQHLQLCVEYNERIKALLSQNKHLLELPTEAQLEWRREPEGPSWDDLLELQLQVLEKVDRDAAVLIGGVLELEDVVNAIRFLFEPMALHVWMHVCAVLARNMTWLSVASAPCQLIPHASMQAFKAYEHEIKGAGLKPGDKVSMETALALRDAALCAMMYGFIPPLRPQIHGTLM